MTPTPSTPAVGQRGPADQAAAPVARQAAAEMPPAQVGARGAAALRVSLAGLLDGFELLAQAAAESGDDALEKGVEGAHAALIGLLEDQGLRPIAGTGVPFDPCLHHAMEQYRARQSLESPLVVEVLRQGYSFRGRLVRPALVIVAR